jgi:hypothetical protein
MTPRDSLSEATRVAKTVLPIFLSALFSLPVFAFDEFPVGARPSAMGEAFTAVADDVHSLYYNPAGLASLYRPEVTAYYARPFPGLSDQSKTAQTFIGAALPIPSDGHWGGLGIGYHEFRVDSLFKEQTVTLAYGRSFLTERFGVGLGLKQLTRTFGSTPDTANGFSGSNPGDRTSAEDPVFQNGHEKSALGMDLGFLYAVLSDVRVGVSLENANRPNVGLTQDDRLPMITRLGAVYDKTYSKIAVDLSQRTVLEGQSDTRLHLGGERQWGFKRFGLLSVRAGGGVGGRDYRQLNFGAGYEVSGLVLDYVFTIPLGAADGTGNQQNISLSFKFGRSYSEDDLADELQQERAAAARAEEAMKAAELEAAGLQEERNKLLNEYAAELERLKAELEKSKRNNVTSIDVPPRRAIPSGRERAARQTAQQEYAAAFDSAMRAYATRVSRGAGLEERVNLLKSTIGKYKPKGVDVSSAEKELERVNSELAQVTTDYRITMDFYKKTAAQGADAAERLSLLERILKKYEPSGINLSEVRGEIAQLKKAAGRRP